MDVYQRAMEEFDMGRAVVCFAAYSRPHAEPVVLTYSNGLTDELAEWAYSEDAEDRAMFHVALAMGAHHKAKRKGMIF